MKKDWKKRYYLAQQKELNITISVDDWVKLHLLFRIIMLFGLVVFFAGLLINDNLIVILGSFLFLDYAVITIELEKKKVKKWA